MDVRHEHSVDVLIKGRMMDRYWKVYAMNTCQYERRRKLWIWTVCLTVKTIKLETKSMSKRMVFPDVELVVDDDTQSFSNRANYAPSDPHTVTFSGFGNKRTE